MITPAEAETLIRANIAGFLREDCPLASAHGRVLRADLRADRDLPPYDRVTMDGYALRSASLAGGKSVFRCVGTQAAGMRPLALGADADACVEVMTGAVLPAGADCVVPYENTERDQDVVRIVAGPAAEPGSGVHRRGSDHPAGDLVVRAGRRITGREIAVAAAVGASTLTVAAQPKIAVVATGDELVEVEAGVSSHQIRRSNDHALRAALLMAGYSRIERFHLRDVRHEIEHLLWHILAEHDVVLIAGGISKGKYDFLPAVLDAQGVQKIFQGVAQRPGKPFWFGLTARRVPVFALPGNPVSAYTCLHRYVLPALGEASGCVDASPAAAALSTAVTVPSALTSFMPVGVTTGADARWIATPMPSNTSGDFAGLVNTDGFVELPPGPGHFPSGYVARFFRWS